MTGKVIISGVSYLNAQPMIYGLQYGPNRERHSVELDIPSRCAERVAQGEVQLGLMPVAQISKVAGARIVGSHCIGAEGEVESVCLLSMLPVERLSTIRLDPESRTSTELCRILARDHWEVQPAFVPLDLNCIETVLPPEEGLLLIGDKALAMRSRFEYVYDLAVEWRAFTGLPFMFAAWISNGSLPEEYIEAFEADLTWGLNRREEALDHWGKPLAISRVESLRYLEQSIDYAITPAKLEALRLYTTLLESLAQPIAP